MLRFNKLEKLKLCDAYIITSCVNRYYISGFKSSYGIILLCGEKKYFFTDNRYYEQAEQFFYGRKVSVISVKGNGIYGKIKEILSDGAIKTIGYEDNRLSCRDFENIKSGINKKFIAAGSEIDNIRHIKEEYELTQIETAQNIAEKSLHKVLSIIKPGNTERDICTELEYRLNLYGAQGTSFNTIVASGSNSSMPHAGVTDKKITSGDFVLIDFGANYNGYCSDMTRTVAIGKPTEEMQKVYNIVLKSQMLALNAIKDGVSCKEIYNISNNYISANGYEKQFLHGLGHGVGLEIHEGPSINNQSEESLYKNMVITIEPGIYIQKKFGVRIEDMAVIKEDGIKLLTNFDKKLIIL